LALAFSAATSHAADGPAPASDAQPGLHLVGLAEIGAPAAAATLGYGYTEPQTTSDGGHHRLSLRAAAAFPVVKWLSLGPIVDGRYDLHPHDSGATLSGALLARAAAKRGAFRFGGELKGWVPGAENASTMLDAASLDLRTLFGAALRNVELAGVAGYRLDRSGAAGKNASALGPGDRLALGVSDFDAVLLGAGADVLLGRTELFAEASLDLLVGRGAPAFRQSPLRLAGGARHALSPALAFEVVGVGSLSAQPDLSPGAALVPNEPRFSVFAGLRYRFLRREPAAVSSPPPPATVAPAVAAPPPPPPATAPADASVAITVHDDRGDVVVTAAVLVLHGNDRWELSGDGSGRYRGEHVGAGEASLRIEAAGFEPLERPVSIQAGAPFDLDVTLKALPPPSQIRGLVRNLGGKGLTAKVRVEPLGVETATDAAGAFKLDVPPGRYEVVIEAPGYAKQRRSVSVDAQGVVVLNAELVKK
jgi:hypothetical protein